MATPRIRTTDTPVELRASVLDAALNLGIRNSVMAKWMFEPVPESDDGDELSNPGLTSPSSSASTTSHSTADDSPMGPFSFRFPGRFASPPDPKLSKIHEQQPLTAVDLEVQCQEGSSVDHSAFSHASRVKDDALSMTSSARERRRKLRKAQKPGYESDGGYVSEGGKKAKKEKEKKGKKGEAVGDESDGGYLSEATTSSKKASKTKAKSKKSSKDTEAPSPLIDPEAFLATVNASLNVSSIKPDGYVTDSGTPSKRGRTKTKKDKEKDKDKEKAARTRAVNPVSGTGKEASEAPDTPSKRSRLLRMMTRSASRDREKSKDKSKNPDEAAPPPVPPLPVLLPIAERFARAGTNANATSTASSAASPALSPVTSRTSSSADVRAAALQTSLNPAAEVISDAANPPSIPASSLNDTSLSTSLWNKDVLIPGSAKPDRQSNELPAEKPRQEVLADTEPVSRTQSEEKVAPVTAPSRSRSPVPPMRSFSPVFSSTISAILSTPEKRRKRKQNASSPGGSVSSAETVTSSNSGGQSKPQLKLSTSAISQPNPHLGQHLRPPPSPLELAATLKTRVGSSTAVGPGRPPSPGKLSPGFLEARAPSPTAIASRTPDSYVFVERDDENVPADDRRSALSVAPSADYIVPSPLPSPSPAAMGLASRRAMQIAPLTPTQPLSITPRGSRSNTPNLDVPEPATDSLSIPNTPTARASVIAYYQIPPPSPPPTGPLPRIPDAGEFTSVRRGSDDRQFLSPAAARYGARSPSPLSRPTSPSGLFGQPFPSVRRGKESPFPARPILPAEDRGALVRRPSTTPRTLRPDAPLGVTRAVTPDMLETRRSRYRGSFVGTYPDEEELRYDAYSSSEELHDKHSSAYIREARARGEKRVYFSKEAVTVVDEDDDEVEEADVDVDVDVDVRIAVNTLRADDDDRSAYAADGRDEDDSSFDRRSLASMSVYSRYSVLDADRSAELREGFVKRVEALYGDDNKADMRGRGRGRWEEIPAVPEIPASLRVAGRNGTRNASSPFRF